MQTSWAMLLLFAGAAVAHPAPPPPLSYEQVLASAIETYNKESGLENAFRLLEPEPQPDWDPSALTIQPLKFSVRETVCKAAESSNIDQCDYKDDGLDRDCSGFYSAAQSPPLMVVQCEGVAQELERIKRGRFKKWVKKIGAFIKKYGPRIASLVPRATMRSAWGVLFLLGFGTAVPLEAPKTFEEFLPQVVKIYNQGPGVQNAFRLLEATPPLGMDSTSGTLQQLNFTMQETTCPASEDVVAEQCEFKPDGLMKDCIGYFSTKPENPMILINCDTAIQEPVHVTRFRGLGGFLKGFSRGVQLWDAHH
ncbi:antimicrobial protein CAP18-like [Eublepharis macularius]|uniref:Vipericidin n=1 Tax=Eublepharis macularius TaxID=481883 RepID=A0AA97L9A6_EUBMA|nr:antimicrobial protein CAP18-like [Eublepharis macularius]